MSKCIIGGKKQKKRKLINYIITLLLFHYGYYQKHKHIIKTSKLGICSHFLINHKNLIRSRQSFLNRMTCIICYMTRLRKKNLVELPLSENSTQPYRKYDPTEFISEVKIHLFSFLSNFSSIFHNIYLKISLLLTILSFNSLSFYIH